MQNTKGLRYPGIAFLAAAIAFFVSGNTALGASFVAIGGAMIAISLTGKGKGEGGS